MDADYPAKGVKFARRNTPIVIESRGVVADSQGFGEFEGAPAVGGTFYPLDHDMTIVYAADGTTYPPKGVLGGQNGGASASWKVTSSDEEVSLPAFAEAVIENGSKIAFKACGGGGYGNPLDRDPRRVLESVNRGWLSPEKAKEAYGVAVRPSSQPGLFEVEAA